MYSDCAFLGRDAVWSSGQTKDCDIHRLDNVICHTTSLARQAMSWLQLLVTSLWSPRACFDHIPHRVGFLVYKVALGQVFLQIRLLWPVVIPPVLHTQLFKSHFFARLSVLGAVVESSPLTHSPFCAAASWPRR